MNLRRLWRDHSVLIILAVLLLFFLVASWILGRGEWLDEQKHMRLSQETWPGYWQHWAYDTVISMLADVWGPLLVIWLGIRWYDRQSAAQDGDG